MKVRRANSSDEETCELLVDTYVEGIGTVRNCLDCGCLIAGGPTRCVRCAKEGRPRERRGHLFVSRLRWSFLGHWWRRLRMRLLLTRAVSAQR